MTELVLWDGAITALAALQSYDEVQDIMDEAERVAVWARQANDTELLERATEIRVRAQRRAGEMLAQTPKLNGARGNGKKVESSATTPLPPTLEQIGVTKDQSSKWQALAGMTEERFESAVEMAKAAAGEVTTAFMLREAKGKPHVSNNSGENEWYTPPEFIEAARSVMGSIDLDPASSAIANKRVGAKKYFDAEQDGLNQKWFGNVWMNPPYAQPLVANFCAALVRKYNGGEISKACVLVNNATDTAWFRLLAENSSATCFTKGRVRFLDTSGEPKLQPLQGQAVLFFGGNAKEFAAAFSRVGYVYVGRPVEFAE